MIKPGNDPITDDVLKEISADLGDEWQRVANALNVKKVRIQAIMKKNVSEDDDDVKYDMLITWAKKVPRGLNKVSQNFPAQINVQKCGLSMNEFGLTF